MNISAPAAPALEASPTTVSGTVVPFPKGEDLTFTRPRGRAAATDAPRREYLTENEVEALMAAAKKRGRYGHRDSTMILLAYRHGLRVRELVDLQWCDVDLEAGRVKVRRIKGSDDSIQPLTGAEIRALRRVRREQEKTVRHIFTSERGAPFTTNGFFKMLSRAAALIGMTDVHPHLLRHGCGFALVNKGVDTRSLAAYPRPSEYEQHRALHEDELDAV